LSVGKKTALLIFLRWLSCRQKSNVLFVRLAFLVQIFNFSTISALCTTFNNRVDKGNFTPKPLTEQCLKISAHTACPVFVGGSCCTNLSDNVYLRKIPIVKQSKKIAFLPLPTICTPS
jgi:hypothetical protein